MEDQTKHVYYLGIEFLKPYYEVIADDENEVLTSINETIKIMEDILYRNDTPILYFDYYGGKVIDIISNCDTPENIKKAKKILNEFYDNMIAIYILTKS